MRTAAALTLLAAGLHCAVGLYLGAGVTSSAAAGISVAALSVNPTGEVSAHGGVLLTGCSLSCLSTAALTAAFDGSSSPPTFFVACGGNITGIDGLRGASLGVVSSPSNVLGLALLPAASAPSGEDTLLGVLASGTSPTAAGLAEIDVEAGTLSPLASLTLPAAPSPASAALAGAYYPSVSGAYVYVAAPTAKGAAVSAILVPSDGSGPSVAGPALEVPGPCATPQLLAVLGAGAAASGDEVLLLCHAAEPGGVSSTPPALFVADTIGGALQPAGALPAPAPGQGFAPVPGPAAFNTGSEGAFLAVQQCSLSGAPPCTAAGDATLLVQLDATSFPPLVVGNVTLDLADGGVVQGGVLGLGWSGTC